MEVLFLTFWKQIHSLHLSRWKLTHSICLFIYLQFFKNFNKIHFDRWMEASLASLSPPFHPSPRNTTASLVALRKRCFLKLWSLCVFLCVCTLFIFASKSHVFLPCPLLSAFISSFPPPPLLVFWHRSVIHSSSLSMCFCLLSLFCVYPLIRRQTLSDFLLTQSSTALMAAFWYGLWKRVALPCPRVMKLHVWIYKRTNWTD